MLKDLAERWKQNELLHKETVDDWILRSGDYGSEELIEKGSIRRSEYFKTRSIEYGNELRGTEKHFASIIRQKLENAKIHKPFIVLDIGGMNGLSWSRLADFFEDEVKNSKVVFVVSNLKLVPGSVTEDKSLYGHNVLYNQQFLEDARERKNVNYVQSNMRQLRRMLITLPNGKSLPISGNCAFIHESASVSAWSMVPEVEVSRDTKINV